MASTAESSSSKIHKPTTIKENVPKENFSENSDFKDKFNKKLTEFYASQSGNLKKPWTKERVLEVIKQIKSGKVAISSGVRRTPSEYYWISKYDTIQVSGEDYLILKKSSSDGPAIRVIAMEDYFDLLLEIHKQCGHGGRDKMKHSIKDKFYIQIKAIEIFVSLCPTCDLKRNLPKKAIVTEPIVSIDFNVRGQVDLIDFQSIPDKEYKWVLNYQDHATKFLHLRPLRSKQASEVAKEMLFIFLEFGAPYILQSDNGPEFTANVLEEVTKLWPECKILHGTPRRPPTQESVEHSNQDVKNLLLTWMHDNKTTNWSIGCRFVQNKKNSSYHGIIGRSPYHALFGCDFNSGLRSSNSDILKSIVNRDLAGIMKSKSKRIKQNNNKIGDAVEKEGDDTRSEGATFSWETRDVIPVKPEGVEEPTRPLLDTSRDTDTEDEQWEDTKETETNNVGPLVFKCDICREDIKGFRYACVQCSDFDLCGGCEAAGAHARHYVLRIPETRPYNEIEMVLSSIRRELDLQNSQAALEDTVLDNLKLEIKEEQPDPLQLEQSVSHVPDEDTLYPVNIEISQDNSVYIEKGQGTSLEYQSHTVPETTNKHTKRKRKSPANEKTVLLTVRPRKRKQIGISTNQTGTEDYRAFGNEDFSIDNFNSEPNDVRIKTENSDESLGTE